jgi:hypothetical protein
MTEIADSEILDGSLIMRWMDFITRDLVEKASCKDFFTTHIDPLCSLQSME